MDNSLVPKSLMTSGTHSTVLILVVMDNSLVHMKDYVHETGNNMS